MAEMAASTTSENITLLAAPQLFGHLFNYGLFGMLVVQVYVYYLSFPSDPVRIKVFVYVLFVIECVQIIMTTHDAFKVFGEGWGDLTALNDIQWIWFDTPIIGGIVSASVQCFFAWRISVLSKSVYLRVFISSVALMQGSGGIATGVMAHVLALPDSALQAKVKAPTIVWLGGSVACDVMIATCMLYYLLKGRQGLASDIMLSRLIRLTIETGTLTASVACVDLVFFVIFKHNNLHLTPALILSKLYTNSLMMIFNNRTQLRNFRGGVQPDNGGRIWFSAQSDPQSTSGTAVSVPQQFALHKFPRAQEPEGNSEASNDVDPYSFGSDIQKASVSEV